MAILKSLLATVTFVTLLALAQCNGAFARSHGMRKDELHARQLEAAKRYTIDNLIRSQQDDTSSSTSGIKNITFSNPLASREFEFHTQLRVLIAMSRVLRRW
jgi:carboxypeptidase D